MPRVVKNVRGLDLRQGAVERGEARQADQDNIGRAFLITQRGHVINSMVGLDNLMLDGNIGADKNVDVRFSNLCHGPKSTPTAYCVKKKDGESGVN